jgi:hypothetical protein
MEKSGRWINMTDGETGFRRLCRINSDLKNIEKYKEDILNDRFSDCHMLRPYSEHKKLNDKYINLFLQI